MPRRKRLPTKAEELQKAKTVWYRKLERSGFEDIESDEDHLKQWSSRFTRQTSINSQNAKQEYYYMATQFLNNHKFESKLEETIWAYHTNGMSLRNIVKTLNKVRKQKTYVEKVQAVVNNLIHLMKTQYLPGYEA